MRRRFVNKTCEDGVWAYRFECAGCSAGLSIKPSNASTGLPLDALRKIAMRKGWEINKSKDEDICPSCLAARRKMRQARNNGVPKETCMDIGELIIASSNYPRHVKITVDRNMTALNTEIDGEESMTDNVTKLHADAPREMKRADRQVIFAKLQDVYPKEDAGYTGEWTDEAVAADLGVPRAWVEQIREENFGPIIDTAAKIRAAEAEAHKAFKAEAELRFRRVLVAAGNVKASLLTLDGMIENLRTHLVEERPAGSKAKTKAS